MVTVSESEELLPTVTVPKLRLVGLPLSAPAVTPVADKPTVSGEFDASETMVTLPLTEPEVCGVKVTLNVVLCELASVSGVAIPLNWNPVPLIETCEISTLAEPLLLRVNVCDFCEPTEMFPKASLLGLEPRSPCGASVPVPESDSVAGVLVALLVTVTVAAKFAAAFGLKLTLTGTLWPEATVIGMLGETRVKYLLEMETPLTLTESGPELLAVNVRVLLLPVCTLPNCRVAVFRERVVVPC